MAEALFTVSDSNDSLAVTVPGYVIDAPCNDVVLSFGILRAVCVPNTDTACSISTGDIVAGGREASDGGLGGVLGVLLALGGVVDGADKDGLVGGIRYPLPFRVGTERRRRASRGCRRSGPDGLCEWFSASMFLSLRSAIPAVIDMMQYSPSSVCLYRSCPHVRKLTTGASSVSEPIRAPQSLLPIRDAYLH